MKNLFLAILVMPGYVAMAQPKTETYTTTAPVNEIGKIDAVKVLLKDPSAMVYKCQLVELTDKVTLKKRSSR